MDCAVSTIIVSEGNVVISILRKIVELEWTVAIEYKQRTMQSHNYCKQMILMDKVITNNYYTSPDVVDCIVVCVTVYLVV